MISSSANNGAARCIACARRSVVRRWFSSIVVVLRDWVTSRCCLAPERISSHNGRARATRNQKSEAVRKPIINEKGSSAKLNMDQLAYIILPQDGQYAS